METELILAVGIFVTCFLGFIFEVYPKPLISIAGALSMLLLGIMSFDQAAQAVDLETIGLLIGMMLLVDIVNESGLFSYLSVKIAKYTKGQPLLILLLFVAVTALSSTFLNNVTVILVTLPIILMLARGIGLNMKLLVFGNIFFSIIGGALTLIGDPTNVIIGTGANLGFNDFLINMWIPILMVSVVICISFIGIYWNSLRPISKNLNQLFLSQLLIQKIEHQFAKLEISPAYIIKCLVVFFFILLGFVFGDQLGLHLSVVALTGAAVLFFITKTHNSSIEASLPKVEWNTLFFFVGLFIMVAGLKNVGALQLMGDTFISYTSDYSYLGMLLLLLWVSGLASMIVDNVAFATMMIPVVILIQPSLPPGVDTQLMWWAMVMGCCLGGCGTPIGSSVNVVALGLAEKNGCKISSWEYIRVAFPMTVLMLATCSVYFYFIV
jgi:Na+/H+ antiporter NhaD/arsenite permease-like protein